MWNVRRHLPIIDAVMTSNQFMAWPRVLRMALLSLGLSFGMAACSSFGLDPNDKAVPPAAVPASVPRILGAQTPAQREHARMPIPRSMHSCPVSPRSWLPVRRCPI
jgi:hypothetical protein